MIKNVVKFEVTGATRQEIETLAWQVATTYFAKPAEDLRPNCEMEIEAVGENHGHNTPQMFTAQVYMKVRQQ